MNDKRKRRSCGTVNLHLALTRPPLPRREGIEVRVGECALAETLHLFAGRFHGQLLTNHNPPAAFSWARLSR